MTFGGEVGAKCVFPSVECRSVTSSSSFSAYMSTQTVRPASMITRASSTALARKSTSLMVTPLTSGRPVSSHPSQKPVQTTLRSSASVQSSFRPRQTSTSPTSRKTAVSRTRHPSSILSTPTSIDTVTHSPVPTQIMPTPTVEQGLGEPLVFQSTILGQVNLTRGELWLTFSGSLIACLVGSGVFALALARHKQV